LDPQELSSPNNAPAAHAGQPSPCGGQADIFKGRPRRLGQAAGSRWNGQWGAEDWRAALVNGPSALISVDGPFAVALHEPGGRVLMAVDRFAIQSLCYRIDNGVLRVAERADSLADEGDDLDPQALYDYLYFHAIPSPRTAYRGVHRLPPGHYAIYEHGQLTVAAYWSPRFDDEGHGEPFESLKGNFRTLLRQSVAEQLDEGKAACYLSGGTDSSTVAGMIREVSGQRAASYSIGFDVNGYDEMSYARLAAKHFDTEHHEYYVTPEDLVQYIPKVAASYDQPFGNSSALPSYLCAVMARNDGVRRILGGDGGDELFGGNTRYAKQRVFNLYGQIPQALRRHILEPLILPRHATPLLRKAASYIQQAKNPLPARLESYNLILRLGLTTVLSPQFLERLVLDQPAIDQAAVWQVARTSSSLNRQLAFDWRYTLAENDLPKVCGSSGLAGLEVGFPMLSNALLDFSCKLPTNYKLRQLKLRWFFKEALRDFLPQEIITKKKQGFGLPFGVWTVRHPGLNKLATDSLGSLGERGLIRKDFITELMNQRLAEHPGYYGEMVWILMMLEHWLQKHAPSYRLN